MYASYRISFSSTAYGSDGDISISNSLKLPEERFSLQIFRKVLLRSIEANLDRVFETFLMTHELKKELTDQEQLSEDQSLFRTQPTFDKEEELTSS